jgi:hypothetical protein
MSSQFVPQWQFIWLTTSTKNSSDFLKKKPTCSNENVVTNTCDLWDRWDVRILITCLTLVGSFPEQHSLLLQWLNNCIDFLYTFFLLFVKLVFSVHEGLTSNLTWDKLVNIQALMLSVQILQVPVETEKYI